MARRHRDPPRSRRRPGRVVNRKFRVSRDEAIDLARSRCPTLAKSWNSHPKLANLIFIYITIVCSIEDIQQAKVSTGQDQHRVWPFFAP